MAAASPGTSSPRPGASYDGDGVDLDEELGAQAGDDVDRDGRRWVGRVPCLLEGGDTFVERVAVDHGDGPVHDVRRACPFALEDGGEVAKRLAGLFPDGGADDLAVGVDAVLPADVDRLRRLFDHDGLAEGRAAVEPLGVDVPCAHVSPSSDDDRTSGPIRSSSKTSRPAAPAPATAATAGLQLRPWPAAAPSGYASPLRPDSYRALRVLGPDLPQPGLDRPDEGAGSAGALPGSHDDPASLVDNDDRLRCVVDERDGPIDRACCEGGVRQVSDRQSIDVSAHPCAPFDPVSPARTRSGWSPA